MTSDRLTRLHNLVKTSHFDSLVLNPGQTLTYLTGLHFGIMERPIVLLTKPGSPSALILPELEVGKIRQSHIPIQPFPYGENPETWQESFNQAVKFLNLNNAKIGVESNHLRVLELRFLESAAPGSNFISADLPLSSLRMQKDESEITNMRQAVKIAQDALTATLPKIKIGMTEWEIASELCFHLLRLGAEPQHIGAIVASGPNSADPHAYPTNRQIQAGDFLVIDWGAVYNGYCSDITRTFAIGQIEPELQKIYSIVADANAAGRAAGKPGIPAREIDLAARTVIKNAGYGDYFIHRTGHGLGMEGHEHPYMHKDNPTLLQTGMCFTVEPGIYLPMKGGVRIEDDVVIIPNGSESLTNLPRELQVIGN
jgi:Xaa-Pro dipeptidase